VSVARSGMALLSPLLLRFKVALIASTPIVAWAAAEQISRASASSLPAVTWMFMIGFSLIGWAVADLDKVAELWDTEGHSAYELWKVRLTLLKTIAASIAAGILMFFLGKLAPAMLVGMLGLQGPTPEVPEMLLLIFTAGAGYMGTRWFDWFEARFFKPR
jgi:hypothetical protein